MTFTPRFGYIHDDSSERVGLSSALQRLGMVSSAPAPTSYASGVVSEPVVQAYDDCVPVTMAKIMRKRIVLQRPKATRDEMEWPAKLSSRWGYWQWLESKGKLGVETTGTSPFQYVELLNERGWCADEHMPYSVDGGVPRIDLENAPPRQALKHAWDQRGALKAHMLLGNEEIRLAIAADLGVGLVIACDPAIISGGVPDDPNFVWDFDTESSIAGWHMIEAESYDERGVWCQNTWGSGFAFGGYVRIGWRTLRTARYTQGHVGVDWVPQTSEEVARALG